VWTELYAVHKQTNRQMNGDENIRLPAPIGGTGRGRSKSLTLSKARAKENLAFKNSRKCPKTRSESLTVRRNLGMTYNTICHTTSFLDISSKFVFMLDFLSFRSYSRHTASIDSA